MVDNPRPDFYCQIKCGGEDYEMGSWGRVLKDCAGMDFTEKEMAQILEETKGRYCHQKCETQCDECNKRVEERRMKTKALKDGLLKAQIIFNQNQLPK